MKTKTVKFIYDNNSESDFDNLDTMIDECIRHNQHNINKERLTPIHDRVHVFYNSVNVLCGSQGSGKTFTSMKEAIRISRTSPETHLLIIICKDENSTDPTVETLKPLLNIPVVYVTEDDAVDYVKNLLLYKRFYDLVKNEH